MSNMGDWGYSTPQSKTADKVDHIADKMDFALDMTANTLMAIAEIERELVAMSKAPTPPRSEQLIALSGRLNTYRVQINDSLAKVKNMTKDIDKVTDTIQNNTGGW